MVALQDPDEHSGVRSIGLGILRQICIRGESAAVVEDLTVLVAGSDDVEIRKAALELLGLAEEYGVRSWGTAGFQQYCRQRQ